MKLFFIAHIGADTKKRARALKNKWVKCVPGVRQWGVLILCLDLSSRARQMAEKREKNKELKLNKDLPCLSWFLFNRRSGHEASAQGLLWISDSHIYHFLRANDIYQTSPRERVKFMPGASVHAYV